MDTTAGFANTWLGDDDDDLSGGMLSPPDCAPGGHTPEGADRFKGVLRCEPLQSCVEHWDRLLSKARPLDVVQKILHPFLAINDMRYQRITSRAPAIDVGSVGEIPMPNEGLSQAASIWGPLRDMLLSSQLNNLLIFVPIGFGTYLANIGPMAIFVSNLIAVIPLSSLLTAATEHVASDAGEAVGALLNISLGNLVELILL